MQTYKMIGYLILIILPYTFNLLNESWERGKVLSSIIRCLLSLTLCRVYNNNKYLTLLYLTLYLKSKVGKHGKVPYFST